MPFTKPYRGMLIDRDLDNAQMDRLNAVPGVTISGTCAGHPESWSGPTFVLTTIDGRTERVQSPIVNTGGNQAELHGWWDSAIHRLEHDREALFAEQAVLASSGATDAVHEGEQHDGH